MGFFKKIKKMLGHEKEDEDNLQPQEESVVSPKIVENSEPAEILYNFKYLDNLIKNSAEEIVLTSDIILDDDEESLYIDGIEVNNDVVINGKGHTIDAKGKTRIFKISSKLTIKNITLKNAFAGTGGGAVRIDDGILESENVNFLDNKSNDSGGVLINFGKVIARYCDFKANTSNDIGGAIISWGDVSLDACDFIDNYSKKSGGAISIQEGNLNIVGGEFRDNSSDNAGGAIITYGDTHINGCKFIRNDVKVDGGAIVNMGDCVLEAENCEFLDNIAEEDYGAICNKSKTKLKDCIFTNNVSKGNGEDINKQDDNLELINCQFDDDFSHYSSSDDEADSDNVDSLVYVDDETLFSPNDDSDIVAETEKHINESLDKFKILENEFSRSSLIMFNARNFKYLDDLIHSGEKEIVLDSNIILEDGEELLYRDGIQLDVEGITIDGNGHTICAKCKTRIFLISADNVTIKNTTLAYAFKSMSEGNGIYNTGNGIKLENCILKHNAAGFGGAIENFGEMDIESCIFRNNNGHIDGSAVRNHGKINFCFCLVKNNSSKIQKILNLGKMAISKSVFKEYSSLYNRSNLKLDECIFMSVPISNSDQMLILNSIVYGSKNKTLIISKNRAIMDLQDTLFLKNEESSISIESGQVKFINCRILQNSSENDDFIINSDSLLFYESTLKNNSFNRLICNKVKNKSTFGIFKTKFLKNKISHSIICNNGQSGHIEYSSFEDNFFSDNGVIINNETELSLGKNRHDDNKILNKGLVVVDKITDDLKKIINNQNGSLREKNVSPVQKNDFKSLDDLVHGDEKKIVLNQDFCFQDYEKDFYEGGIELDVDDLVIDGKGNVIDGAGISRIFIITGKNITLKNIVFKNGSIAKNYDNLLNNDGGAIRNNFSGDLKIKNCKFINCKSTRNGGVLSNSGKVTFYKIAFSENKSLNFGGAIYNSVGDINISESQLNNNSAVSGCAFYNLYGMITASDLTLEKNKVVREIYPSYNDKDDSIIRNIKGKIDISNANFNQHEIEIKSNFISNDGGEIKISDFSLKNFNWDHEGELIYNNEGNIHLDNFSFNDLELAKYVKVIENNSGNILISDSSFKNFKIGDDAVLIENNSGDIDISESSFSDLDIGRAAIVNEKGKMHFVKSSFINCVSDLWGVLIRDSADTQFTETSFIKNSLDLIHSKGKTLISTSSFCDNASSTIIEVQDDVDIVDSTFKNNSSKSLEIRNKHDSKIRGCCFSNNSFSLEMYGNVDIRDCSFSNNNSKNLLVNFDALSIVDSSFNANVCANIINNDGSLKLKKSEFIENETDKSTILNSQEALLIDDVLFKDNNSKSEYCNDIYNEGILRIENADFSNNKKTVYNNGVIFLNDSLIGMDEIIFNKMNIISFRRLGENQKNFKYLQNLIDGKTEITLDCDIMMDYFDGEGDIFIDGIELSGDNLVIDGCGHSIDAQGAVRIFEITRGKVTFKNITFVMGNNHNNGGAILNSGGNEVNIKKCCFKNNFSKSGGAVCNLEGRLKVMDSTFESNNAGFGGAISSGGSLRVDDSIFKENTARNNGGAIGFCGKNSTINKSRFMYNMAKMEGGGIYRKSGDLKHQKCYFRGNEPNGVRN